MSLQLIKYRNATRLERRTALVGAGIMFCIGCYGAVDALRTTTVRCRDAKCNVYYTHPLLPKSERVLDANSISEVRIAEYRARKSTSTTYDVLLVSDQGQLTLTRGTTRYDEARSVRDDMNNFLLAPRDHVVNRETDPVNPGASAAFTALGAVGLFFIWYSLMRTRVV